MFDPYHDWLGITDDRRPPNLYELLGLEAGESNRSMVEAAARHQLAKVQQHISGPQSKEAWRIIDEITLAKTTLLDPAKRAAYDAIFRIKGESPAQPAPPVPQQAGSAWYAETAPSPPAPQAKRVAPAPSPVAPAYQPPAPSAPNPAANWAPAPVRVTTSPQPAASPFTEEMLSNGEPAAQEFPDTQLVARRRRANTQGPNFMLIGGGALALGLVAGGIWFAMKSGKSSEEKDPKIAEQVDKKSGAVKEIEPKKSKEKEKTKEIGKKKVDKKKPPAPVIDAPPPLESADEFKQPRIFRGHEAPPKGLAVSADGKQLLTTSDDLSVLSWVPGKDRPSRRMTLKSQPGVAVAFLPGTKQAVAIDGGFINIFDLATNEVIKQMVTPDGGFQGLAAAPDGKHILTCSTDGRLRWWDITKDGPERTIDVSEKPLDSVALAADGKTAITGTRDGMLSLWDVTTGKMRKKWAGHKGSVASVAISPDQQRAVSSGEDKLAKVWDVDLGTLLLTLTHQNGSVVAASFSVDGRMIFTASDTKVRSWDAVTGDPLRWTLKPEVKPVSLAIDPKDHYLVAGLNDGAVQLAFLPAVRPDSPLPGAQAKTPKQPLPLPLPSAVDEAVKALKGNFKSEYAHTEPEELLALHDKLLTQARIAQLEPAARFASFQQAREIAAKLGSINDAFKAVTARAPWFEGDDLADKVDALKLAGQGTGGKATAEAALSVIEEAERQDRPDIVEELFRQRELFPQAADAPELNAKIQTADKRWVAAAAERDAIAKLVAELTNGPDQPAPNLAYGKHLCFRVGEWADGLPRLAKGDDAALKDLATRDLANPKEAKAQADLSKRWFDHAAKAEDAHKAAILIRSKYWCDRAVASDLTAQDKLPVGQRLTEIGKQLAQTTSRPGEPVIRHRFNTLRSPLAFKTQWNLAGPEGFTPDGVALKADASMTSRFRMLDGCRMEMTFIPDGRSIKVGMNGGETAFKPTGTAPVTLVIERKGNELKFALTNMAGKAEEEKSAMLPKPEPGRVELKIVGPAPKDSLLLKSIVVNGPVKPAE